MSDNEYDRTVNYESRLTELGVGKRNEKGNFVIGATPQRFVSTVNPDDHYQQALWRIAQLDDEDFLNVIHRALMDRPGCVESALIGPDTDSAQYRYNFTIDEITRDGRTTPTRDVVIKILVGRAER